ncbi:MAG: hypothetical protein KH828_07905 [Clostridiales bacterium]|nr:hypothetical protein [Clostridiales bacterium]
MSFLTELPPKSLYVDGVEHPIDTDFRTILRYSKRLDEAEKNDMGQVYECLSMVYVNVPDNILEAASALNWFVRCGKEEKKKKPSNKVLGINSKEPFDFTIDGELIWSAFRRNDVYGIDLHTIEYLHWWKFIAMLNDLHGNTRLSKVMDYRTIDTNNGNYSKEMKAFYGAMQKYYEIHREDERNEELVAALKEGRDPTPYL